MRGGGASEGMREEGVDDGVARGRRFEKGRRTGDDEGVAPGDLEEEAAEEGGGLADEGLSRGTAEGVSLAAHGAEEVDGRAEDLYRPFGSGLTLAKAKEVLLFFLLLLPTLVTPRFDVLPTVLPLRPVPVPLARLVRLVLLEPDPSVRSEILRQSPLDGLPCAVSSRNTEHEVDADGLGLYRTDFVAVGSGEGEDDGEGGEEEADDGGEAGGEDRVKEEALDGERYEEGEAARGRGRVSEGGGRGSGGEKRRQQPSKQALKLKGPRQRFPGCCSFSRDHPRRSQWQWQLTRRKGIIETAREGERRGEAYKAGGGSSTGRLMNCRMSLAMYRARRSEGRRREAREAT